MDAGLTKIERETLKAMYRAVGENGNGGDAHTGSLAGALGVSPATVTAKAKRLAVRGLADHQPDRGVELTASGRKSAARVMRRHRIVERFLADMLGYAWNEADRLAARFEHELPEEVEDRLFVALNRPSTCPHGFPIPDPEVTEIAGLPSLYTLGPGDTALVAVPASTDPAVVVFLEGLGLRPGVRVQVKEKHPFDGPIVIRVDEHDRTLGSRVAQQLFVTDSQPA